MNGAEDSKGIEEVFTPKEVIGIEGIGEDVKKSILVVEEKNEVDIF